MNPVRLTLQGAFTDDYREPFLVENWRMANCSQNLLELEGVMRWLHWRMRGKAAFRIALV